MTDPSLTKKQIAELDKAQAATRTDPEKVAAGLRLARETAKAEIEERQQLHDAAAEERDQRRSENP